MKRIPHPLVLVLLASLPSALQGFGAATDASLSIEVERLLWLRGGTDVQVTRNEAGLSAAGCGASNQFQQVAEARGFAAVNGFVLSNGWAEALDDDGASSAGPAGCIDAEGGVGGLDCASVDTLLAAALGDVSFTQDAASVDLSFTLAAPTNLAIAYEFLTFEDPADASFFDAFAILLDGQVVAGGTTHLGSELGADPWTLTPSGIAPAFEFQSIAPAPYHLVPGHSTGRRELSIDLTVGTHDLTFHVADSRGGGTGMGCGAASDQLVSSALVVGLHEVRGSAEGASVTSGTTLASTHWTTVGHPVPGGRFGGDFQLVLEGLDAPCVTLLFSASTPLDLPLGLGALAPLELLLPSPVHVYTEAGFGSVAYPAFGPIDVPLGALGSTLVYQAFGIDPADGRVFASPAKPLLF